MSYLVVTVDGLRWKCDIDHVRFFFFFFLTAKKAWYVKWWGKRCDVQIRWSWFCSILRGPLWRGWFKHQSGEGPGYSYALTPSQFVFLFAICYKVARKTSKPRTKWLDARFLYTKWKHAIYVSSCKVLSSFVPCRKSVSN